MATAATITSTTPTSEAARAARAVADATTRARVAEERALRAEAAASETRTLMLAENAQCIAVAQGRIASLSEELEAAQRAMRMAQLAVEAVRHSTQQTPAPPPPPMIESASSSWSSPLPPPPPPKTPEGEPASPIFSTSRIITPMRPNSATATTTNNSSIQKSPPPLTSTAATMNSDASSSSSNSAPSASSSSSVADAVAAATAASNAAAVVSAAIVATLPQPPPPKSPLIHSPPVVATLLRWIAALLFILAGGLIAYIHCNDMALHLAHTSGVVFDQNSCTTIFTQNICLPQYCIMKIKDQVASSTLHDPDADVVELVLEKQQQPSVVDSDMIMTDTNDLIVEEKIFAVDAATGIISEEKMATVNAQTESGFDTLLLDSEAQVDSESGGESLEGVW